MSDYEERKQARIDRYRERAEEARQESQRFSHESISMLEHIPPGQPILVGHHSERGHRNLLKQSDKKMEKAIAASEKADYYERKAEAAERTRYRRLADGVWADAQAEHAVSLVGTAGEAYAFSMTTSQNYWDYMLFPWAAQYSGNDAFVDYFNLLYTNSAGEKVLAETYNDIKPASRLKALEVIEAIIGKGSADVLVKPLLNEREVTLPVATDCAPFYHWADLRAYWLGVADRITLPDPRSAQAAD